LNATLEQITKQIAAGNEVRLTGFGKFSKGADTLTGGASEDVLVDGPPVETSADYLYGLGGDDALIHNGGADHLDGGEGSDLFLSVSLCDGETINGGTERPGDRDNASWARLAGSVAARLDEGLAGEVGFGGQPVCASGSLDRLEGIEDLEGSNGSDYLVGDTGANQLLGHKGEDTYYAEGGADLILANSGSRDAVIDCGPGTDSAVIDLASVGDPAPIECENVREGAAEEFRTEIEEPAVPAPAVAPPVPALPTTAPNRRRRGRGSSRARRSWCEYGSCLRGSSSASTRTSTARPSVASSTADRSSRATRRAPMRWALACTSSRSSRSTRPGTPTRHRPCSASGSGAPKRHQSSCGRSDDPSGRLKRRALLWAAARACLSAVRASQCSALLISQGRFRSVV